MDNNSNNNDHVGAFMGNMLGVASNSSSGNIVGSAEELGMVKVDYDMHSGGYGSWSVAAAESMQAPTGGVFTTWND